MCCGTFWGIPLSWNTDSDFYIQEKEEEKKKKLDMQGFIIKKIISYKIKNTDFQSIQFLSTRDFKFLTKKAS